MAKPAWCFSSSWAEEVERADEEAAKQAAREKKMGMNAAPVSEAEVASPTSWLSMNTAFSGNKRDDLPLGPHDHSAAGGGCRISSRQAHRDRDPGTNRRRGEGGHRSPSRDPRDHGTDRRNRDQLGDGGQSDGLQWARDYGSAIDDEVLHFHLDERRKAGRSRDRDLPSRSRNDAAHRGPILSLPVDIASGAATKRCMPSPVDGQKRRNTGPHSTRNRQEPRISERPLPASSPPTLPHESRSCRGGNSDAWRPARQPQAVLEVRGLEAQATALGNRPSTPTETAVQPRARPRVNPFGDAKPREVLLAERGMDWRKLDFELEHRSVDRKETEEEKILKEEIRALEEQLNKESEVKITPSRNKPSRNYRRKHAAQSKSSIKELLTAKEKQLQELTIALDDKVRYSQMGIRKREGEAAERENVCFDLADGVVGILERPYLQSGCGDVGVERPVTRRGRVVIRRHWLSENDNLGIVSGLSSPHSSRDGRRPSSECGRGGCYDSERLVGDALARCERKRLYEPKPLGYSLASKELHHLHELQRSGQRADVWVQPLSCLNNAEYMELGWDRQNLIPEHEWNQEINRNHCSRYMPRTLLPMYELQRSGQRADVWVQSISGVNNANYMEWDRQNLISDNELLYHEIKRNHGRYMQRALRGGY